MRRATLAKVLRVCLLFLAMSPCVMSARGAQTPGPKVWKFAFGPPGSATRAGFTKVTAKDVFAPERGYGFQAGQGLTAFDRGGSEIARPKDDYTASVYGAYRTTSDLTCGLIEGERDNAFDVALPDGEYLVWLIAGDAEWDPPLFEVWANGRKKLDVRIPRARFVFMEPFRARAEDGRLRIEFKGPHGWVLNGLVIGKEGPELAEVLAKLERDIFFLTEPELPNWKQVTPQPANPPLDWTPDEQRRGYVAFPVDYAEQVAPTFVPARAAIGRPMTALATPGELEPATFCILAREDLGDVTVELSDFVSEKDKQSISRQNVTVGIVRCWPQRSRDLGGKGEYQVVPEMIEPPAGRARRVVAGQAKQWWLTVRVPGDAASGRYRMTLTVRPEKAPATTLEWRLLVLPFGLIRPADKHWGTWLEGFPPNGKLYGPQRRGRNVPAEVDRLAKADMADYRDHGFDLALVGCYPQVKETPEGGFTYDLGSLGQSLDYFKALGSDAPVVVLFEYACRDLEYRYAEDGAKHVPGTFSPKARKAIVGLAQYMHDEAQRRGWPKLLYYPIDEPGNNKTQNRMLFAENVLGFVHEVPGCRTATTLTAGDLQHLGDRVDVRIYAYEHYNRDKVVQDARGGHPFWFYQNGMFYGHSPVASRGLAGFEFLRSGAEVATAWGFDATQANPWNDFDGGHKDWNVIFPGVDTPTPTIYWELCREGVDDCRYVATLQHHIRQARQQGKTQAAADAEGVLGPLLDPSQPPIDNPQTFARYRWRIAREILKLTGDRDLALPFAAIANNPSAAEQVGPNLIADPSFEAGPKADGFPGPSYGIADAYSKSEARPVGALSVTREAAHSGRFSLKWDFGKAAGKGSVYAGRRYLIVNVQVPQEVARQLRGKRVKVGYWFRLGGGPAVPGMTLRQFGKNTFLDGISYNGGVDDPAVWTAFHAQGRLRDDFEGLDIHISCPMPDDPTAAAKSVFYIDDLCLQAIEEPPLALSTSLDEYYLGEPIPWTVTAASPAGQVKVQLLRQDLVIAEQTAQAGNGPLHGTFETAKLKPGVYSLQAVSLSSPAPPPARRQIILAPDPFP